MLSIATMAATKLLKCVHSQGAPIRLMWSANAATVSQIRRFALQAMFVITQLLSFVTVSP